MIQLKNAREITQKKAKTENVKFNPDGTVQIGKTEFKLNDTVNKKLYRNFSIDKKTVEKIAKSPEAHSRVLSAAIKNTANDLLISYDSNSGTLIDIANGKRNPMLSKDSFIKLFETIGNYDDSFSLENVQNYTDGYQINIISDKSHGFMENEVFKFGLSMRNDVSGGVQLYARNLRLICSNGMTQDELQDLNFKQKMSEKEVDSFFSKLKKMKENSWIPENFLDGINKAKDTPISVAEFQRYHKYIKSCEKHEGQVNQYFDLDKLKNDYQFVGTDLSKVPTKTKKTLKSNINCWDAVNNITHFFTHTENLDTEDRVSGQLYAGKVLTGRKDFDEYVTVKCPY